MNIYRDVYAAACCECALRPENHAFTVTAECHGCGRPLAVVNRPGPYVLLTWCARRAPYCSDRCRNRVHGARFRKRHPRPKQWPQR
jgi:hypothetical protein